MNRNNTPGLGEWMAVTVMVVATLLLFYKLYQYAGSRSFYPSALTIGNVDVGGLTPELASEILNNRYLDAPIVVMYGDESFEIRPTDAEFKLDLEAMLNEADYQRDQLDFWSGFWGFLWGIPYEVQPIPLHATHNREALIAELRRVSRLVDQPAQPPQPVPGTLSFQEGVAGLQISIDASLSDVESALYRPSNREAHLVVQAVTPERPEINLLTRLLVNYLQDFEQSNGGTASIFIMDLKSGEEVNINANVAMSGFDLLKVPIVLETYRAVDGLSLTQQQLISDTLIINPDNTSANALLNVIAGQDDPYLGAKIVTDSMQKLGLVNTFMVAPYNQPIRAGRGSLETPANSVEQLRTAPSPEMQTTAEDTGTLLSMIYYCAQGEGGTLLAVYRQQLNQAECQEMLDYMKQDDIGSLIQAGVPSTTAVAHRHGWINDTHADAGIVYSPGGDYVIVIFLYQPTWLEWAVSSPLIADISRATYNFFNFNAPFLGSSSN